MNKTKQEKRQAGIETYINSQEIIIWLRTTRRRAIKVDEDARPTVLAELMCLQFGVEFVGTEILIA